MNEPFEYKENKKYTLIKILIKDFDYFGMIDIPEKINDLLQKLNYPNLIIDISPIRNIDSKGIGFFFAILKTYNKENKKIVLVCDTEEMISMLDRLNISKVIKIFENENEAIEHMEN